MFNNEKIELSENFFSFSTGKLGLLNGNNKRSSNISLTPSPNRLFREDIGSMPDMDFSTSTQSTTPTGATISLSSKNNFFVSQDTRFEQLFHHENKIIEINKTEQPLQGTININTRKRRSSCLKSNTISYRNSVNVEKEIEFDLEEQDILKMKKKSENSIKVADEIQDVIHSLKKSKTFKIEEKKILPEFTLEENTSEKCGKEIEEDLKYLTNSQEIRDFHEYTEDCMKIMKNIIQNNKFNADKYLELDEKYINLIKSGQKKLAVFDLDETLVHRDYENYENCDHVIQVKLNNSGTTVDIGIYLRPHLIETLQEISKNYILILFTASQQIYADKVLELFDPKNEFFIKRLYRDSCKKATLDGETIYIKDIEIFKNVPQEKIVIIDNSVLSFCNQIDNGIPILPFYKNKEDVELKDLKEYLNHLHQVPDVRLENKKIIGLSKYYETSQENSFSSSDDDDVEYFVTEEDSKIVATKNENCNYDSNASSKYYNTNSEICDLSDILSLNKKVHNDYETDTNYDSKDKKELFFYLEVFQKKFKKLYNKGHYK